MLRSLLKEAEYFIDLDDIDPVHIFALLLANISLSLFVKIICS